MYCRTERSVVRATGGAQVCYAWGEGEMWPKGGCGGDKLDMARVQRKRPAVWDAVLGIQLQPLRSDTHKRGSLTFLDRATQETCGRRQSVGRIVVGDARTPKTQKRGYKVGTIPIHKVGNFKDIKN
jgi:hypothetical protein